MSRHSVLLAENAALKAEKAAREAGAVGVQGASLPPVVPTPTPTPPVAPVPVPVSAVALVPKDLPETKGLAHWQAVHAPKVEKVGGKMLAQRDAGGTIIRSDRVTGYRLTLAGNRKGTERSDYLSGHAADANAVAAGAASHFTSAGLVATSIQTQVDKHGKLRGGSIRFSRVEKTEDRLVAMLSSVDKSVRDGLLARFAGQ